MSVLSNTRQAIRDGKIKGSTAGLCDGYIQANVVILPSRFAVPFAEYCKLNPKPCPLIVAGGVANPILEGAGKGVDIRTDVPSYYVYEHGELKEQKTSILDIWDNTFVAFALGCSFSFERALIASGIPIRHIEKKSVVPMFQTNVKTKAYGDFAGPLVVSMRPIPKRRVNEVVSISGRFAHSHGAPVHIGAPDEIGILNLNRPDWGDPVAVQHDEVPVFWACGVTSQSAIENAKPPIAITHKPGSMLITELPEDSDLQIPGLD